MLGSDPVDCFAPIVHCSSLKLRCWAGPICAAVKAITNGPLNVLAGKTVLLEAKSVHSNAKLLRFVSDDIWVVGGGAG
jgi:hypothetical protein